MSRKVSHAAHGRQIAVPQGCVEQLAATLSPALEDLPRVPRQARSREKRVELMRAAARTFIEQGYANTTADEIAAAAGVSVGTFYNYFRNKRQILVALVLERLEDIFTPLRLAQMDLTRGNYRENIRVAVAAALSANDQTGLRRVWAELMSVEPELIPYQQRMRRYVQSQLEDRLVQAKEQGLTWPNLDVRVTALAILTLVDALNLRRTESVPEKHLVEGLTDMIYRAIFAVPAAEAS